MVEFTEVMRNAARICDTFSRCNECPLSFESGIDCKEFMFRKPKDVEELIMKWAAEHPAMTNAEKFKEVFGCEIHRGGCDCIGIEHECIYNGFNGICQKCEWKGFWGKEYKEPEEKEKCD